MPRIGEGLRSERRQRLIEAAWECARTDGGCELTVAHVRSRAGISKGAVYAYFQGRQELLLALLRDDAQRLVLRMGELEALNLGVAQRLQLLLRELLSASHEPGRARVRADIWISMLSDERVLLEFLATVERHRGVIRRWVQEGVEGGELYPVTANAPASILPALADGLRLHGGLGPGGFRWEYVLGTAATLVEGLDQAGSAGAPA